MGFCLSSLSSFQILLNELSNDIYGSDRYFRIPNTSKDVEPSKKEKSTDTSKGATKSQPNPKSTSKFVHAEETVYEAEATEIPQNQGDGMGTTSEQPNVKAAPKRDWFKKPARPPTPDLEWNICKSVDDGPTQNWLSDLVKSEKPSKPFNKLMSTPIDFTAFAMNRLYGTHTLWSPIKVAYDKHVALVKNVKVNKWYGYGHLEEIEVRRSDQKLYKFMEGDFP
ncbi:hypothetical protein Tco_0475855 [Tanacetum coccineum]